MTKAISAVLLSALLMVFPAGCGQQGPATSERPTAEEETIEQPEHPTSEEPAAEESEHPTSEESATEPPASEHPE